MEILTALLERERARFQADPTAASQLLSIRESSTPARGDLRAMLVQNANEPIKQFPSRKLLLGEGFATSFGHAAI